MSLRGWAAAILLMLAPLCACRRPAPIPRSSRTASRLLGYTIQAGAFAKVENAARLSERLKGEGLEATYFAAKDGLFKVRFGDFPSRETARRRADTLLAKGVIETYYLVAPETQAAARRSVTGDGALREELVRTAENYLGLPYLWGGSSAETGFDCSGLTMSVYRLNGLSLPRSSRDQFQGGSAVGREELQKGDLLFFATGGSGRVNHVGLYIGDGKFIHAPRSGQNIRRDSLENPVLSKQFLGARSYL
ncbi:C40 family peptidase [Holophaga foetida]|uniref:C40 family peptidase n=1 Tax=Holophaga foetida TaxID=35839 RepID=UPI0002473F1A|nr:NlpC/P60 family protein [Holophaga foetida]